MKKYRSNNHHKYSLNDQKKFHHGQINNSNDQKDSLTIIAALERNWQIWYNNSQVDQNIKVFVKN